MWSGDYTGSTGGEDSMLAAIKSYQKRNKAKVTGAGRVRNSLIAARDTSVPYLRFLPMPP